MTIWDYQPNGEFISNEIIHILEKFQNMKIEVPLMVSEGTKFVPVHIPYMMQTVSIVDKPAAFAKLAQRHQERIARVKANRENASIAIKHFLQNQFYINGKEQFVAEGRADIRNIQKLLQAAVNQGLISATNSSRQPDSRDLRAWLKYYGIGIDCSAFAQHTLTRVVKACYIQMGTNPSEYQDYEVGWMRATSLYERLTTTPPSEQFERLPAPLDARPGDILIKKGHIRLVVRVTISDKDGLILDLAESTSARDIPKGQNTEENDIGPRLIRVQYSKPDQPILQQSPRQLGVKERFTPDSDENSYIIGRLKKLSKL